MDFLNGLGKKLTVAARSVHELTKENLEVTRLSADLRAARNELEHLYCELGRAYYTSLEDESMPIPQTLIDRIRATLEHMDTLAAQKENARPQRRCPGCGASQGPDAKYCSNCGRRMPEEAPALEPINAEEDAEYCSECGAMRHNDEKYCSVCGASYEKQESPAQLEAPVPPSAPAPDAPEAPDSFECD